jgi:hypothetical protein
VDVGAACGAKALHAALGTSAVLLYDPLLPRYTRNRLARLRACPRCPPQTRQPSQARTKNAPHLVENAAVVLGTSAPAEGWRGSCPPRCLVS